MVTWINEAYAKAYHQTPGGKQQIQAALTGLVNRAAAVAAKRLVAAPEPGNQIITGGVR